MGDFFGVDAVIFVFAAMDQVEIEGMSQDEGDAGFLAGVGQPIPAEHAFGTDSEAVAIRLNELEEVLEVIVLDVAVDQLFALAIHDADVHLTSMQIDSAVVFGGGRVILHTCNTSWLMGAMRHPLIMFYAGGAGNTPRPISPR